MPHCDANCVATDICEDPASVVFVPNAPGAGSGPVRLFWTGRLENALAGSVFSISVKEDADDAFLTAVKIKLHQDRLEALGDGASSHGIVNHDFTTQHTIIMRVSFADGTYAVQVAGQGQPTPSTGSGDPCQQANIVCGTFSTSTFDSSTMRLVMEFDEVDSLPPGVAVTDRPLYRIDNVRIDQPDG